MSTNECCVCKSNDNIVTNTYSHCPYDHKICTDCFLLVLQMCYCETEVGEPIYKCPLCRNEYKYSNKEMNNILVDLAIDDNICLPIHKKCQYEMNNITKKCQFKNCGCRVNIVDIITDEEIDLSIKMIVNTANRYPRID